MRRYGRALVLVALLATSVAAQQIDPTKAELELAREAAELPRRGVVAANLPLTAAESEAFWPVYGKYRDELGKAGARRSALLARFVGSLEGLSSEAATEMLDEYLALEKRDLAVKTRWAPRFRRVIPAAKVARLYQIENKLDVQAKMELAQKIPLVK